MSAPQSERPRRRVRRLVIVGILGALLGLLVIFFFARIYNPFGTKLADPLVLVPPNADVVITIPNFPEFMSGVREQPFVSTLRRHRGFQRFLSAPAIRERGVADKIQEAFQTLDDVRYKIPGGLDLLGDVSGNKVVLAAYIPSDPTAPWPFFCIFTPNSWLAQAATNILIDEQLAGFGVDDELEKQGVTVKHFRDSVSLQPKGSPEIFLTRIADAVIVSTEGKELDRIRNHVILHGIPTAPAVRFSPLNTQDLTTGREADINILGDREKLDQALELSQKLLENWGAETYGLATSMTPPLGGQDVTMRMSVQDGLTLRLTATRAASGPNDLFDGFRGFSESQFKRSVKRLGDNMPKGAFSALSLDIHIADFLRRGIESELLMTATERKFYNEELSKVPSFGSLDGILGILETTLAPQMDVCFFRQPREALDDEAEPGYVLACPISDSNGIKRQLDSLVSQVASGTMRAFKAFDRTRLPGLDLYRITPLKITDERVQKFAIAILGSQLLLTNYEPYIATIPERSNDPESLSRLAGIHRALNYTPDNIRVGAVVDASALFAYMDQSIKGWAYEQTQLDGAGQVALRQQLERDAKLRGFSPDSPASEAFIDREFKRVTVGRFPELERDMRFYVDCFRGVFSSLGFFIEDTPTQATFIIRLDVAVPDSR